MKQPIIEIAGLTKKYGNFTAVDHLNLTINKGEVFGLLGPNGAGKSTTILMLLGLSEPTEGSVKVCGFNAESQPIEVKRVAGYLPENVGFYEDRSGLDNLIYTAKLNGFTARQAKAEAEKVLERVGLTREADKLSGKYSRGMRQRLGLANVLIKNPQVIILDEPTLGLDPSGIQELLDLIVRLSREDGITVLFSSHHLHQVQRVCDRVGLFVKGKLLDEGDIESLSKRLFADKPIHIAAASNTITSQPEESLNRFKKKLEETEGVLSVQFEAGMFTLNCSKDITGEIAALFISSGLSLNHLVKKEYGLDDIYNLYFEGGERNES